MRRTPVPSRRGAAGSSVGPVRAKGMARYKHVSGGRIRSWVRFKARVGEGDGRSLLGLWVHAKNKQDPCGPCLKKGRKNMKKSNQSIASTLC